MRSPTYYPGEVALAAATVVTLEAAEAIDRLDFAMKQPTGLKVSGQLLVLPALKPLSSVNISLLSVPDLSSLSTDLKSDGSFEFLRVPPGRYVLGAGLGLPDLVVVVADRDIGGLEIGAGIAGVRVTGRLVSPTLASGQIPALITLSTSGGQRSTIPTESNADGTFEFMGVPPGTYTARTLGAMAVQSSAFAVADKDLTGIELAVPFQVAVSGRLFYEDGMAPLPHGVRVEARRSNGTTGAEIQSGDIFTLNLAEGEHVLSLRNLPLGYAIKSASYGNMDIRSTPLKVSPEMTRTEIRITLGAVPLDSIRGVNVSGRLTGPPSSNLTGGTIALQGRDPAGLTIETVVNANGMFEFPKVPPGSYSVSRTNLSDKALSFVDPANRFIVGNDNISGLQIGLSLQGRVAGRVIVVDENGRPSGSFPTNVGVSFQRGNGSNRTSVRSDGTFTLLLGVGEHSLSFRLPSGYSVLSAASGTTDLLKAPLKIDTDATFSEILVRLEYKQ